MANCLVAQSGGPTAVINASLAGLVKANQLAPVYNIVYGGLHGIEGILQERLVDLTNMSEIENRVLRQTPASALGSCRYKLKRTKEADYLRLVEVMDKYNIDVMFYIGGNDSMDTVDALASWAHLNNVSKRFIGIPKTIDNDLMVTDHCPGFGSAAKFIVSSVNQTWLDLNVYTRQEVFILETMGRDAGWLACASVLSNKVDLLVVPEVAFERESFLNEVRNCLAKKNKCYIVVSEGAKYPDGSYIAASEAPNDLFGHAQLGGVGYKIKQLILEAKIAPSVKVQDLATLQRCSANVQSLVDVSEAFQLGMSAHMRSAEPGFSGYMVGVKRSDSVEYNVEYIAVPASQVANHVKHVPIDWILPNYQGVKSEVYDYLYPLIQGEPVLIMEKGVLSNVKPYYMY